MQIPRRTLAFSLSALAIVILGWKGPLSVARGAPVLDRQAGPASTNWTAQQDHRNMMEQLGIKKLRPGPSGQPSATNAANYDPGKANPYPDLPDPLTLKNGQKVATAVAW